MKTQKEKIIINFKKAASHINKIITMMEENKYCIDIMQQNLAVVGILKSANQMLMEDHLNNCFKNAMQSHNDEMKNKMIKEILRVSKLYNK